MRYPILNLDFPIPVTIGSGRVVIDDAGVMRLDLFSPEEQIVVMEKLAPTFPNKPESPEHIEGCCAVTGDLYTELDCDAECWCHTMPHLASDMPESGPWALQRMCNCSERQAMWDRGETAPACPIHGPTMVSTDPFTAQRRVRAQQADEDAAYEKLAPYDPRAAGTVYPPAGNPCPLVLNHSTHEWYSPFSSTPLRCPGIKAPDPVIEEQLEDRLDYDARGQTYDKRYADTDPWGKVLINVCEACGCVIYDEQQHDLWHVKTRSRV
jgi:hypothetical protein